MLAYILAFAVGLGSLALYTAALFFPEVYRKGDFIWSGVGLFYALVLWACAGQIRGGLLLGQTASVALLGWLGWQTLIMRRALTPSALQTPVSEDLPAKLLESFKQLPQRVTGQLKRTPLAKTSLEKPTPATTEPIVAPEPPVESAVVEPAAVETTSVAEAETVPAPPLEVSPPLEEAIFSPETTAVTPTEIKTPAVKKPQSQVFAQAGRLLFFVKTRFQKTPKVKPSTQPFPSKATSSASQTSIDDDFDFEDLEDSTPETPSAETITPPAEVLTSDSSEAPTVPEVVPPAEAVIPPETVDRESLEIESPQSEEILQRPNPPESDLVEAAQAPDSAASEDSSEVNSSAESAESQDAEHKET